MKTFEIAATSGRTTIYNSPLTDTIYNHAEIELNSVCERSDAVRVKMVNITRYPNRNLDSGLRSGSLTEHQLIKFFSDYRADLSDFQFFAPIRVREIDLVADVRLFVSLKGKDKSLGIHLFKKMDLSRFIGRWVFLVRE